MPKVSANLTKCTKMFSEDDVKIALEAIRNRLSQQAVADMSAYLG